MNQLKKLLEYLKSLFNQSKTPYVKDGYVKTGYIKENK